MTAVLKGGARKDNRSTDVSLMQRQITAPPESSDEIKVFEATSYITCWSKDGKYKRFLKKETLSELLSQIHDGQTFNFRMGMRTSKNLSENDYRLAMSWMRAHGLCIKDGQSYTIPSIEQVRRKYNEQLLREGGI